MNNSTTDDEARVLAALGSTAESASTYESSVLHNALLNSAPQIALPTTTSLNHYYSNESGRHSSSTLVSCGDERPSLPDLSSLAPSTATTSSRKRRDASLSSADVPHVLTVLSRTRDMLQSTFSKSIDQFQGNRREEKERTRQREIDLLHMKEHILLGYLTDVAGLDENDELIPQKRNGRKRHRENTSLADEYYGSKFCGSGDSEKRSAKEATVDAERSNKKKRSSLGGSSSTNRLDRIKNGENLDASSSDKSEMQQKRVRRNTIMSMKRQMRIESGLTPIKTMEEERFDIEKARQMREERRKRRVKKQRAALGMEYDSAEEEAELEKEPAAKSGILKNSRGDTEGLIYNEEEAKTGSTPPSAKECGIRWADNSDLNPQTDKPTTPSQKRAYTKVFCPVCQTILTVSHGDGDDSPDLFLSKHIEECQKSRQARGVRSLRKRANPSIIGSGEGDEDADYVNDNDVFIPDDNTLFDDDIEADGETSAKETQSTADVYVSKSVDDVDEFDYEDRVDDWIEHGIARMNDMSERDADEVPPGAVVYEGGLEVPAWINDRLFPYQRIGLRWMWELYCVGAGGCVGDEMGLG